MADEAAGRGRALRSEAAGLGSTIKQGLSNQVEQQKNGIADRIGAVAERAQRTADDLRDEEAWLGDLLGRGRRGAAAASPDDIRDNDVAGSWARSRCSRGASRRCSWAPPWRWASR